MLLLFAAPSVGAHPVSFRSLFSPDRYVDMARHWLVEVLPRVLLILLLAWILMRTLRFFTARIIHMAERHAASTARVAQARTLASVVRATGIGVIGFLAVLELLPLLGFNLGPLLASAGVAGVAIGLACQTVVKDCLNGTIILLEDQYNVGDVITVAGVTGTVEAMSLRKSTLRDGDGTLYIIPNSQITPVANKTWGYAVATVNVDVDFSADPDKVIQVLTETAMSVRNDPRFKEDFLADPTVLGVDGIKGSEVSYPILLKTLANRQWGPKRELQRRVRIALAAHHLLPGDPLRVFTASGPQAIGPHRAAGEEAPAPDSITDPTARPSTDINPFTGHGL